VIAVPQGLEDAGLLGAVRAGALDTPWLRGSWRVVALDARMWLRIRLHRVTG